MSLPSSSNSTGGSTVPMRRVRSSRSGRARPARALAGTRSKPDCLQATPRGPRCGARRALGRTCSFPERSPGQRHAVPGERCRGVPEAAACRQCVLLGIVWGDLAAAPTGQTGAASPQAWGLCVRAPSRWPGCTRRACRSGERRGTQGRSRPAWTTPRTPRRDEEALADCAGRRAHAYRIQECASGPCATDLVRAPSAASRRRPIIRA
jgi:hypothetical protein